MKTIYIYEHEGHDHGHSHSHDNSHSHDGVNGHPRAAEQPEAEKNATDEGYMDEDPDGFDELEKNAVHHPHGHHHSPEEKKRQLNRLARVIGHLNYVKRMIEEDEDCADVLTQISASKSALTGLGKEIINEHITHCIYHAIEDGDTKALDEFQKAIEKFM